METNQEAQPNLDEKGNPNILKEDFSTKANLLTLPVLSISESCIETKINLNFYFHISFWCLKRFYKDL